ncbi:MAG: hypothetical protein CME01_12645 [Geminicoccus sp.]|nr:hypothetical protein [Geminicoccus sp.]
MILGLPVPDFLMFVAVMAAGAVVAGFVAGLFGVGGGIVMVLMLTEVFGLGLAGSSVEHARHLAVGTSLAIIVPTSIRSASTHYASGQMDMNLLRKYVIFIPVGVVVGLYLATIMDAGGLGVLFGAIALCVGTYQLVASPNLRLADQVPGTPIAQGAGLFIGSSSTLMGIGGGVMNNLFMTLSGAEIRRAIATSAGVGILISVPAALGFVVIGLGQPDLPPLSLGYVNVIALAFMIPFTIATAPVGARLTHRLPGLLMKRLFSAFLILVAIRTFWKVFLG